LDGLTQLADAVLAALRGTQQQQQQQHHLCFPADHCRLLSQIWLSALFSFFCHYSQIMLAQDKVRQVATACCEQQAIDQGDTALHLAHDALLDPVLHLAAKTLMLSYQLSYHHPARFALK